MKRIAIYRLSDGAYCDNSDSYPTTTIVKDMIEGQNVIGRFGGVLEEYVPVETDEPEPWNMKLVAGVLVTDNEKLDALAALELAGRERAAQIEEAQAKVDAGTALLPDIMTLLRSGRAPDVQEPT